MTLAGRRAAVALATAIRPAARQFSAATWAPRTLIATYSRQQRLAPAIARRWYSPQSLDEPAKVVDYDAVIKHIQNGDANIVDVREPDEYNAGHIPGALNIPFRSSPGALGLEPSEFEDTFGFKKPDLDSTLVFYCMAGVRSAGADQLAATYGYKSRENYEGSYKDWTEHNGEIELPTKSKDAEAPESQPSQH